MINLPSIQRKPQCLDEGNIFICYRLAHDASTPAFFVKTFGVDMVVRSFIFRD